ncbi:cytochrome b N-terminal domain-containing protein [Fodinibius halophilus]|uniref:Hydrogenase iron-sulfur subunit n=1 Tax=Fodinibius halophilus TaxID=1736908 RepID=A0A6M1T3W4_9BACT|nr:cytochrome b N-terminal domain-containing protein [Fodinibius halophilus]NGP88779.1 hydrogenase iron-sulfur subunit [Fodinibius halophilus]
MNTEKQEINLVELASGKQEVNTDENDFSSQVKDQRPDPPVRGESVLRVIDRWFHQLDRLVERYIPQNLNPFTQSGAIANTTFIIALVSGFVLLFWYKPSVHQAYSSLDQISPLGDFFRSLHRYSSDACMLFIMFHAFKMFFARRFSGARWLAWVTGIVALALLWFDGWLGYWLVWDEAANQVAVGTAKMLDQLPIFAEPLSRSFLTDDSFDSLLFFLVFFFHMLIPLAMGIALWLHVSRLNKAHFITKKPMTIAVLGSLGVLSAALPAGLAKPAKMLEIQQTMPLDYFYMLPMYFTDRLEGGALWAITLIGFIAFVSVPWVLVKKRRPKPQVDADRCNGCEQCYKDCPFNAITMLPRAEDDKKRGDFYASIDPSKCIACGICVGSCDPVGIEFPRLPAMDVRREIDSWLHERLEEESSVDVAYICSNSAGADLHIDEATGRCKELPGYIVRSIPCVGWVHPLMIERALRKGAEGVLIVGCQSEPDYRLGAMWTEERISGGRHPELRNEKVDSSRIHYLQYDRTDYDGFIKEARELQRNTSKFTLKQDESSSTKMKKYIMGAFLVLMLSSLTYFFSNAPYSVPIQNDSELVVSFTMPGRPVDSSVKKESEQQNLQSHMQSRNAPAKRERSDVRLRIDVDGETVHEQKYEPSGLYNDGMSGAVEYIPLKAGAHTVEVYLGDTTSEEWLYTDQKKVVFKDNHRSVIKFNRADGFQWYPKSQE